MYFRETFFCRKLWR